MNNQYFTREINVDEKAELAENIKRHCKLLREYLEEWDISPDFFDQATSGVDMIEAAVEKFLE